MSAKLVYLIGEGGKLTRIECNDVYVFDFDGTLVKSNEFKIEAFYKVFESKQSDFELIKEIISNVNLTRYKIIEILCNKLNMNYDECVVNYNQIVNTQFCPQIQREGSSKFLKKISETCEIKPYIISATPTINLIEAVKNCFHDISFSDLMGSEISKSKLIHYILFLHGCKANNVHYFGDGVDDYDASLSTGVNFIPVCGGTLEKLYTTRFDFINDYNRYV